MSAAESRRSTWFSGLRLTDNAVYLPGGNTLPGSFAVFAPDFFEQTVNFASGILTYSSERGKIISARKRSSVGQSVRFTSERSRVRAPSFPPSANVVQWQNTSFPSWICGFDSRHLLHLSPFIKSGDLFCLSGGAKKTINGKNQFSRFCLLTFARFRCIIVKNNL